MSFTLVGLLTHLCLGLKSEERSREPHIMNARRQHDDTSLKPRRTQKLTRRPRSSWPSMATRHKCSNHICEVHGNRGYVRRDLGCASYFFVIGNALSSCSIKRTTWSNRKIPKLGFTSYSKRVGRLLHRILSADGAGKHSDVNSLRIFWLVAL